LQGFGFIADTDPADSILKFPAGQMIFVFNLP
jgi:hypothetical protein